MQMWLYYGVKFGPFATAYGNYDLINAKVSLKLL